MLGQGAEDVPDEAVPWVLQRPRHTALDQFEGGVSNNFVKGVCRVNAAKFTRVQGSKVRKSPGMFFRA